MIRNLIKILTFFLLPLILAGHNNIFAQQLQLSGLVQDSLHNPVPYTNIIATPLVKGHQITFSIADNQGRYKLELQKEVVYKLQLTHLGFAKGIDTIFITRDIQRNFTLLERTESLEEVKIEAEMAMIVKPDTIVYRTDQFNTGEERKLREVLDNLPGVEVDRAGNVTVNGKQVTKLLVEGKTFFTGDTKMGVNNIPADAVDEVVALDNYHEVAFLKDLSDSDQLALNIKLKEGKKKFAFGEVEAGGGYEEKYLINPTLFYYSPRSAINVIGDINNTGDRSFTFRDYINFEGGISNMIKSGNSLSGFLNSDVADFLGQKDFIRSTNEFLAGSISHQLSSVTSLDAYTILSNGRVESMQLDEIIYLTDFGLDENRETFNDNEMGFTLNKVKLRLEPDSNTDISYNAVVKTSSGTAQKNIVSETEADIFRTQSRGIPDNSALEQDFRFSKRFSYEHTSTITALHRYKNSNNNNDWLFDRKVFSEIIPFVEDNNQYNLLQQTNNRGHDLNFNLKHYWVLNNLNHIYPETGASYWSQQYTSMDFQKLADGSQNSFQEEDFNNNIGIELLDLYAGFEYKFKSGEFTIKPGLMFHNYKWWLQQYEKEIVENTKMALLPSFKVEWDMSPSEKMDFNYAVKSRFSDITQFTTRYRLADYNQLFLGNSRLENELYHSASLRYRKINLYQGIILNTSLVYSNKLNSVQNTARLDGVDRIVSPQYTDLPETNINFRGGFSKGLGDIRLSITGYFSLSDYTRLVNREFFNYNARNYRYQIKGETSFEEGPNFEAGIEQRFNYFRSHARDNNFIETNPFALVEYGFWRDFIFKMNYAFHYYSNKEHHQENHFQRANASLYYSRENSLWGFELEARNLFNIRYRNSNSLNQFMITDRRIFVQPRMLLFMVTYKI